MHFFAYLIAFQPLVYIAAFIGMIVEGDAFLFAAGFITQSKVFNPVIMWTVLVAGAIVGDILWYKLGHRLDSAVWKPARWFGRLAKPFDRHVETRPFHTLFISKFAYGLHHAIVMRAGALRVDINRFIKLDVITSILWVTIIGGLGYFSGASFIYVKKHLRFAEVGLLIALAVFLLLERVIAWQIKKRL